ncbi:MAG: sulfate adenylyltransferase subunit CysD [Actinobacteria bacterium]|nr:sulfate adenylyltransferase subunit CysD [Actinomycetota bacterium]
MADLLDALEAEGVWALREAAAAFRRPVLLYSIGKDSGVLLHLARKAFYPGPIPFPVMHVDTTWKFRDMITFRDQMVSEYQLELIVATNEAAVAEGVTPFSHGSQEYTRLMKTVALREALDEYGFDAAIGGSRRDEERSRAKERIFSLRMPGHRWEPRRQRPELWRSVNSELVEGQTMRVFPLSNWTELDVWRYIRREGLPVVPLYFAAERPVVVRQGQLIVVDDERMQFEPGETSQQRLVRFRSLGCYPLSAAVASSADTLDDVIAEMESSNESERAGRLIDGEGSASMESKKVEGYF